MEEWIKQMNEKQKIESGKEYNLGELIKDLEKYKDSTILVEFDNGKIPTQFSSWRGSYCELALEYEEDRVCYAHDLYREAYNANGSIFVGYKGGNFEMDLNTPIHQANYGECGAKINNEYNEYKIVGIKEENGKVIIITRIED